MLSFVPSSNQLSELPREVCQMPLQVLLVQDNVLTSLPKEIGRMTTLAELDASHNRLTQVPMTIGDCVGLRALDLSNNQLGLLPLQITYLRLEYLDVSCNCISSLPLELRNMTSLVTFDLDNNPLVSPPTTVCMRGRVHIFKYLENMAARDSLPTHKRVEETKRSAKHNSYINSSPNQSGHQITSGNATIDCLRHKPRHVVDSGYCTDGVDKRWSNEGGGEAGGGSGSGRSTPSTPSTLSPGAALSRTQSLSSETPLAPPLTPLLSGFRISPEGNMSNGDDKSKLVHQQTYRQYKEALRQQRQHDIYRSSRTDQNSPELDSLPQSQNQSPVHTKSTPHSPVNGYNNVSPSFYRSISSNSSVSTASNVPNSPLLHSTPRRFQNQNGNAEKEENKRPVQKVVPSRNVNNKMYTNVNGNMECNRVNGAETYVKPTSPTKSPTNSLGYNSLGKSSIPRANGDGARLLTTSVSYVKGAPKPASKLPWNKDAAPDKLSFTMKREFDKQKEEEELLQQLRVIIESRLKMSLPEQLAPVLADGVVLCHLANHVRPRSVASVHVPSPAQPKLTMARCRRNVDNFLEACRKIGVEEEEMCEPADILQPDQGIGPLARTLSALLARALDIRPDPYYRDYESDSIEIDYRKNQRVKHPDERYISDFNFDHPNYTIDESEEYLIIDNNDDGHYSPVYGVRQRATYHQNNRVQFVQPFYKDNVLRNDNFEIYDTDEVDFNTAATQDSAGRYERGNLNLDIQNNLNRDFNMEIQPPEKQEDRVFATCLCLGTFVLAAIILIMYPL
ncbi:hypothetical protein ACJJTC_012218 [Scirpophaga incertulas]